jgi:uncharacterized protein
MEAKFELKKTYNGSYFFNLKIGNGEIILTSEMYRHKRTAEFSILSLKTLARDDRRYERKTTETGSSFFVFKADNGAIIGHSEVYSSTLAMENGIESVKKNAVSAYIVHIVD